MWLAMSKTERSAVVDDSVGVVRPARTFARSRVLSSSAPVRQSGTILDVLLELLGEMERVVDNGPTAPS